MTQPKQSITPGSVWRHTNGSEYTVLHVTSESDKHPDRYPVTVVYRGPDGRSWPKRAEDWHASMTLARGAHQPNQIMEPVAYQDAPKEIWLNTGDAVPEDIPFEKMEGVTWCDSQIDDYDIKYVRADLVAAQLEAARADEREACAMVCEQAWEKQSQHRVAMLCAEDIRKRTQHAALLRLADKALELGMDY